MKPGILNLGDLETANYAAIIELATQPANVLLQVTLRADKIHDGLIRLGETPDDEARCWIRPEHVNVVAILGKAYEKEGKWFCKPILEVVNVSEDEAYAMACP